MKDMDKYIHGCLVEAEKIYPVVEWEIDGIQIWPLVRVGLRMLDDEEREEKREYNYTNRKMSLKFLTERVKKFFDYGKLFFKDRLKDRSHNDFIDKQRDIVFLSFSAYRKAKLDGQFYFTEIFPLLQLLPLMSYLILEVSYTNSWKLPRFGKSVFLQREMVGYLVKESIRKHLLMTTAKHTINCPDFDEVALFFRKRGIFIYSLNELIYQVENIKTYEKYFVDLLKKVKPKFVVVECYYCLEGFSIILAAKKLGIATADLQHGVQGAVSLPYGNWPSCFSGYQLLPEYFLVWGKNEKNAIDKWGSSCGNKHKALITGHPWITMWKKQTVPLDFKRQLATLAQCKHKDSEKHILFTLGHGGLPESIISLIQNSPKSWQWWIRMHPTSFNRWQDISARFPEYFKNCNVNWVEASSCPLPALFSFIDLHITYESTVAIECAEWGISSIIERFSAVDGFVDKKYVKHITLDKITIKDIFCALSESVKEESSVEEKREIQYIIDNIL